jgi:predicted ATP-dependent serine protease
VTGLERRLREAERLGFKLAIVPLAGRSGEHVPARIGRLEVVACRTLLEALEAGITAG